MKQHLHNAEAEHLLLKLARNETDNVHPYLMARVLRKERPDVLDKLVHLYRWEEVVIGAILEMCCCRILSGYNGVRFYVDFAG